MTTRPSISRALAYAAVLLVAAGCATKQPAPVIERAPPPDPPRAEPPKPAPPVQERVLAALGTFHQR